MKKRKISTPQELHLSYMCEYIDDYHDVCKFAKELVNMGFNSKSLLKLSDINQNKNIKDFDKHYNEFIKEYELSDITYENAGLCFFYLISKEFVEKKISLNQFMENFYYLYNISNSGLQSKNFDLNKKIRDINELYKIYNILYLNKDNMKTENYNNEIINIQEDLLDILKEKK